MRRHRHPLLLGALVALSVGAASCGLLPARPPSRVAGTADRVPRIRPDYSGTVIPPNIAPLNFVVQEPGSRYHVTIRAARGKPIEVRARGGKVVIPIRPWRRLLSANQGETLRFEVYARGDGGGWTRFADITNEIAREPIDRYIAYRLIHPIYNFFHDIGIYQRDLEGYRQREVIHGRGFGGECVNCHAFRDRHTDRMAVGIRGEAYGSSAVVAVDGTVTKLGTMFGYTAWHPSGQVAAYSANKVRQFFHWARPEVRDVVDLDSGLAYFDFRTMAAGTDPAINDPERLETYPEWTPDGTQLYFVSAPFLWPDRPPGIPPPGYDECRYDLMRVSYDLATNTWGRPETVLSAEETGKSILLPRVSPDGRFVLFCMCDYGCFPIYQPSSDLYLMDLQTGEYRRLGANSDRSESWHSWSSNGRWIAFSSKRRDGLFTRTYFSYVDEAGEVRKPLIMPQRDPAFYDSFVKTYTVPEFTVEPVRVRQGKLAEAVRWPRQVEVASPVKFEEPATPAAPIPGQLDAWRSEG